MCKASTTILALTTALAAGCAANGERYVDHAAGQRSAVSPDAARVLVYRPADTMQYSGRAASLALDGAAPLSLRLGGFLAFDVAPGEHRFEVDLWDAPGRCSLSFTAAPGTTAYFEVAPRPSNLAAGLPGALVTPSTPAGLLTGLSVMLSGMAAESAGKSCGGAFAIAPVDAAVAEPRLAGLRASR